MALSARVLAACPPGAQMPGSVFTQKGNSSVPFADISYSAPKATDTLLLVHFDLSSGGIAPTSVTYGGLGLTQLMQGPDSNAGTQQVWYLLGPKPGSATLHVATSGPNVAFNNRGGDLCRSQPGHAHRRSEPGRRAVRHQLAAPPPTSCTRAPPAPWWTSLSYGSGDAPTVTLGSGQTQAFLLNGNPSSTVSSTLPSSVSHTQTYTFQWPGSDQVQRACSFCPSFIWLVRPPETKRPGLRPWPLFAALPILSPCGALTRPRSKAPNFPRNRRQPMPRRLTAPRSPRDVERHSQNSGPASPGRSPPKRHERPARIVVALGASRAQHKASAGVARAHSTPKPPGARGCSVASTPDEPVGRTRRPSWRQPQLAAGGQRLAGRTGPAQPGKAGRPRPIGAGCPGSCAARPSCRLGPRRRHRQPRSSITPGSACSPWPGWSAPSRLHAQ